jgi:hypothetical protein
MASLDFHDFLQLLRKVIRDFMDSARPLQKEDLFFITFNAAIGPLVEFEIEETPAAWNSLFGIASCLEEIISDDVSTCL